MRGSEVGSQRVHANYGGVKISDSIFTGNTFVGPRIIAAKRFKKGPRDPTEQDAVVDDEHETANHGGNTNATKAWMKATKAGHIASLMVLTQGNFQNENGKSDLRKVGGK